MKEIARQTRERVDDMEPMTEKQPSTQQTPPVYEWRTDDYIEKWRPLNLDTMRMDAQGVRAFRRFARLLKPGGPARWFDFTRYRPRIGAACNSQTAYQVRRTA